MAQDTNIEWTDKSWNFLRGCSRVSEGCRNCYAERTAIRFAKPGESYHGLVQSTPGGPKWTGKVEFFEHILLEPLKWRKPCRVFVNSMSDLFHEKVKDEWLDKAFAVMALTPQHTFQILTKRPERMLEWFNEKWQPAPEQHIGRFHLPAETVGEDRRDQVSRAVDDLVTDHKLVNFDSDDVWTPEGGLKVLRFPWPLLNVWLGVSVEDQKTADERIPLLLQTPAAVRWISAEPLLGPVDFDSTHESDPCRSNFLSGVDGQRIYDGEKVALDWVVVGGESGPGSRPCAIDWIQDIVGQCLLANVPVFVKQLGAKPYAEGVTNWPIATHTPNTVSDFNENRTYAQLKDKKGGDIEEWPGHLRVRQMPEVVR